MTVLLSIIATLSTLAGLGMVGLGVFQYFTILRDLPSEASAVQAIQVYNLCGLYVEVGIAALVFALICVMTVIASRPQSKVI